MAQVEFPYGRAPFWILVLALLSGSIILVTRERPTGPPPDLECTTFAKPHWESYHAVLPEFEKERGVRVEFLEVLTQAQNERLQAALQAGAKVPDVVEIGADAMAVFARGPIEDIGFVDLTERIKSEGIDKRMVDSRFSLWSSRGHIFGLPHDVHPTGLAYRRDIVEQLGIDVSKIETWDDFARIGREVTKDLDGDGNPDRYMIDLPSEGGYALTLLCLQRSGIGPFDAEGHLIMNNEEVVEVIDWYIHQSRDRFEGKKKVAQGISFPAGDGQGLSETMTSGLVLFYFCPDWRTELFEQDVPGLSGKMALMPLPAWKPGGRRVSTWGGTGLFITKQCKNPDLAWDLAKFLYLKKEDLAKRFLKTGIIPPVSDAWDLPEFDTPNPFFSNQPVGRILAELAPSVPANFTTPYTALADQKLTETFLNSCLYYQKKGDAGLREYIRAELKRNCDYIQRVMDRNVFLNEEPVAAPASPATEAQPRAPGPVAPPSAAPTACVCTPRRGCFLPPTWCSRSSSSSTRSSVPSSWRSTKPTAPPAAFLSG